MGLITSLVCRSRWSTGSRRKTASSPCSGRSAPSSSSLSSYSYHSGIDNSSFTSSSFPFFSFIFRAYFKNVNIVFSRQILCWQSYLLLLNDPSRQNLFQLQIILRADFFLVLNILVLDLVLKSSLWSVAAAWFPLEHFTLHKEIIQSETSPDGWFKKIDIHCNLKNQGRFFY